VFPDRVQRLLTVYAAAMAAGVVGVQIVIAVQDQRITLLSTAALAAVAIGYGIFLITHRRTLHRVRYASLTADLIGYVLVNGSYWLHAGYLWATGQGSAVDAPWYGMLFGMGATWGLGLGIHCWASIRGHGFEDALI
jgi:hypothetical protein